MFDVVTFALCKRMMANSGVGEIPEITDSLEEMKQEIELIKEDISDNVEATQLGVTIL